MFSGYGAEAYCSGIGMFSRYISLKSLLVKTNDATFNATITNPQSYGKSGVSTSMQLTHDAEERMIDLCINRDTRDAQAYRHIDNVSKANEAPRFLSMGRGI